MVNRLKKCFTIFLIIFIMLFQQCNISNAAVQIRKEQLYPKGEIVCLIYNGIKIGISFVVYQSGDKEYPAYCVNRERAGVNPTDGGYAVTIEQYISNNDVWKAITSGYPYHTPEELGCNNEIEAFAATKMASYHMMYEYDLERFEPIGEEGQRVLTAMKDIINKAQNSSASKQNASIDINEIGKWQIDEKDKKYMSKQYEVTSNIPMGTYIVSKLEGRDIKITDLDNKHKQQFQNGDKFKVLIPISDLTYEGEFKLNIVSKVDTKPIFYGKSTVENKQDYAITADIYEDVEGQITQKTPINHTKLQIYKQDGETKSPIQNAEFQVLDENDKVVYSGLRTNKDGYCIVENIIPGKYYIKEVGVPDGYEKYEEKKKIIVEWNQDYILTVDNFKKKQEEPKQEEIEKIYDKIEVLPRTGF